MALLAEGSAVRRFIRNLEVKNPPGSTYAITQLVNSDLIPMDSTRRIWGPWKYIVYWATGGELSATHVAMDGSIGIMKLTLLSQVSPSTTTTLDLR